MPRKPKPKPDNPEQSKRFIEAAREAETDESSEAFERIFQKIVRTKTPTPSTGTPKPQKTTGRDR